MNDDNAQYNKVNTLLSNLEKENKQAFIPSLVILEVIWVLSSSYKVTRSRLIECLSCLLNIDTFNIEHSDELTTLLEFAKSNTFDISDLMIAYRCQIEQNLPVMTFDKKASKFPLFQRLQ